MSLIDSIIIQVRAQLQVLSIKLWLEPYYYEGIGTVESEIDELAENFSRDLDISVSNCKLALTELQEGALRKLAARQEYNETGIATFTVRRVNNREGTQSISQIKCPINALALELHSLIAAKLELSEGSHVKCISMGRIVDPNKTLAEQGLKTNQQLMVIVSDAGNADAITQEATMYDRIQKIKTDIETIVDSGQQLFEMEDQDGNAVFLPPDENRALLFAMGLCEKARVAMKRQHYDEALVLLLEADEKFSTCNSKFLESVDNFALVNLDIVWCYLCLKNVTQLPDAERRLTICEKSFNRSYGENMKRLIAIKGTACPERALLMRLHLLQGVVLFHQNQRNEAYEKFEIAAQELIELKVDEDALSSLVVLGYEPFEARLGLRASGGSLDDAINFIHNRKEKLNKARSRSKNERALNKNLPQQEEDWVHPRSICKLMEMGFERDLVVEALKQTKNNVMGALDLLQTSSNELRLASKPAEVANENILEQLVNLGFMPDNARTALEINQNNLEKAIDFLIKLFESKDELSAIMERIVATTANGLEGIDGPSTSAGTSTLIEKVTKVIQDEMQSIEAYKRFNEDVTHNDQDYLDLPLLQEEQYLAQYQRLLAQ